MSIYRSVEEIIAASKQRELEQLARAQPLIDQFCDPLRGFIEISGEWKQAADEAFAISIDDSRNDFFTARAVSLSLLTTKMLEAALDMTRGLSSGAVISTMVDWRYVVETKNIALMIDLDVEGTTGFLWLQYGMIEQAKARGAGNDSKRFSEQAKRILSEAGFEYKSKAKDSWAIGVDGRKHNNAVDRSKYVWAHRKFPAAFSEEERSYLAESEQQMIRASNAFAHPTLASRDLIKENIHPMMLTTVIDAMAVLLAYKVSASDVAGWPYTETVGEQFHVYPADKSNAGILSVMVKETYDHCLNLFRKLLGPYRYHQE